MPLEAPTGSRGRAGGGRGPVPPRAGDKVERPEGSPGRAPTRPEPGRAEEAGRGEGRCNRQPHFQRICSAPFLLVPIEGKVRACKPPGRRESVGQHVLQCPEPRLTRPISGHWAFTWTLDWIQTSSFPVNLPLITLWHLGLPVTFWEGGGVEFQMCVLD